MDLLGTLQAVRDTLKKLFSDKGELKGFDDWDAFLGCVMMLDQLIYSFSNLKGENEQVNHGKEESDG